MVNINDSGRALEILFDYSVAKFSRAQADSIAYTFHHAIKSLLSISTVTKMADLRLVSKFDEQKMLEWNSTPLDGITVNRCIHHLVEDQVVIRPEAESVCAWDGTLTYAQLNILATNLAHHLVSLGVRPDTFVPFCFEKSMYAIISILGILKAGGAFVPLDPADPISRKRLIVAELGAKVALASKDQSNQVEELFENVVTVESSLLDRLEYHAELPTQEVLPNHLSYAIFTSGSTGKPKAVVIDHKTFSTGVTAHSGPLNFTPSSRVFQFSAHVWDISLAEIITTLTTGGCICVPSDFGRMNRTVETMEQMKVNYASLTPSFVRSIKPLNVPSLRTLVLVGEAAGQDIFDVWANKVRLMIGYGPAECCIHTTSTVPYSTTSDSQGMRHDNIGRPMGAYCWITEATCPDQLMPIGCLGEILIEGPIVARGYLNDTQKTETAFVSNLEWSVPKSADGVHSCPGGVRRFYRTGDIGKFNWDGTITFIGRQDGQIKVRGQRLELGEVEHHIIYSNMVRHALVAYPKTGPFMKQLTAIVVLENSAASIEKKREPTCLQVLLDEETAAELRTLEGHLSQKLPVHAIPQIWIPVEKLPRTASGKLGRVQINQWVANLDRQIVSAILTDKKVEAPVTEAEKRLQVAWAQVFGLSSDLIGRKSSFFRLGGDSVLAMRLVAVLRASGVLISVADIFERSRLDHLAQVSAQALKKTSINIPPFSMLVNRDKVGDLTRLAASQCNISEAEIADIYPASPLQEVLIAMTIQQPGAYVASYKYPLPASIDLMRLNHAWQTLCDERSILRTRLASFEQEGTMQVVLRSGTSCHFHKASVNQYSFEMTFGKPLVHVAVFQNQFIMLIHHALFDAWSLPLIMRDLTHAYEYGHLEERSSFRDFVYNLQQADNAAAEQFWSQYLFDAPTSTFPAIPCNQVHATRLQTVEHEFSVQVSRQVASEITTATLLQVAWGLVIGRYLGLDDVTYGLAVSGRDAAVSGITEIIGPTIAIVPVRIRFDSDTDVATLLKAAQHQAISVARHGHLGLKRIGQLCGQARLASNFQNLLVIYPSDDSSQQPHLLGASGLLQENSTFQTYALTVTCKESRGKMKIAARFDSTVLSAFEAMQMLGLLGSAFEALTGDLLHEIKAGQVIRIDEEHQAETALQNSRLLDPVDKCVHDLFKEQAVAHPDTEAICAWDGSLTFSELDEHATRLSRYLSRLGVGPETIVPFCFEKSMWAVVAILGIMKAGGACAPLDPFHPRARQMSVVDQVNATVILTSTRQFESFRDAAKMVVTIDASSIAQMDLDQEPRIGPEKPNNAVYVIFTSGSTGTPKGVIWEHRMLCTAIRAHGAALKITSDSRVLQFASYIFDASVLEVITTLLHGGCVCIPSDFDRINDIAKAIRQMNITWAFLTPTIARIISPQDVPGLKILNLGGEPIGQDNIEVWSPYVEVLIGFGPAECCVCVSVAEANFEKFESNNIGNAVGCRLWITHPADPNRLCPLGSVGEILVEGPILARGYLGDNSKTQRSFIFDPSWARGQHRRRFYRTGDLGKFNSDGTISFMARKDTQIKVRGQRLEVTDVEHHLTSSRHVQHTAISVPKSGYYKGQVVAAVEFASLDTLESELHPQALRITQEIPSEELFEYITETESFLEGRIPSYGVPSIWIPVQHLPWTTSGKIDRRAVEQWISNIDEVTVDLITRLTMRKTVMPVQTDVERELRRVWSNVLNVAIDKIGRNSSFVRLGGDSINAIQVVASCRAVGLYTSVQDVLRSKTIERLALGVRHAPLAPISAAEETDEPFDLTPIQKMHMERCNTGSEPFSQSFLLRVERPVVEEALETAIRTIVLHHSMLRARFVFSDGKWRQWISSDVEQSYAFRSHHISASDEIGPFIESSELGLDFQNGPLFIVNLFTSSSADNQILFLTAHHMVVDLVSWRIIIKDLEDLLGGSRALPAKSLSFQTWSRLKAEYVRQNIKPRDALPFDIPASDYAFWDMERALNLEHDCFERTFSLDQTTSALLLGPSNDAFRTEPLDLLLSAIIHTFQHTFPERKTPAIFNEGHGRGPWDFTMDVSRTVGWFTTLYPVALGQEGGLDLPDTVRQIKDRRRSLKWNGSAYLISRYSSSEESEAFQGHFPIEIQLNFASSYQQLEHPDSLFSNMPKQSVSIPPKGSNLPRTSLFNIESKVNRGELQFSISYNRSLKFQNRIRSWIDTFHHALRSMAIDLSQRKPELTLSDFPLLSSTYPDLERFALEELPNLGVTNIDDLDDIYPCSPMQQGILVSRSKIPEQYNVRAVIQIRPDGYAAVDVHRLALAWQKVVNRHAILRTVFSERVSDDASPQQVVLTKYAARIALIEISDEKSALEKLEEQPALGFTAWTPHHRMTVCYAQGPKTAFCQLEISHALTDAASMSILWRELLRAYDDTLPSDPGPLFSNYIRFIHGDGPVSSRAYWKKHLENVDSCLFPRLADSISDQTKRRQTILVDANRILLTRVPFDDADRLHTFCKQHGYTAANVFQAAWAITISAYTGSSSPCFGYLSSGRDVDVVDIQDAVGPYISMLICRMELSPEMPLAGSLDRIQSDYIESLSHSPCSLADIQHDLGLAENALFNTVLSLQTFGLHAHFPGSGTKYETIYREDPSEVSPLEHSSFTYVQ